MNSTLSGKRALVTGAAAGIGRATAVLFAEHGAEVFGLDRQWGRPVAGVTCLDGDVTRDSDVGGAVVRAAGERGLDIFVANAGAVLVDDWLTGDVAAWRRILEVNLLALMRCFQAAGANMVEHGRGGRLLATASVVGVRSQPVVAAYSASKAGVVSVVQSAALAFARHGITVNAVAPGEVDTAMNREGTQVLCEIRGFSLAEARKQAVAAIPLGRLGEPEDIAAAFLFLASDAAGYVTGITLPVDGGLLLI